MAFGGGTFTAQNKTLPGAYMNFISTYNATSKLGERGVCAFAMNLSYGEEGKIIRLTKDDFKNKSLQMLGLKIEDSGALALREVFKHAHTVLLYRVTEGGTKASGTLAEALYTGTFGNRIKIDVKQNIDGAKFDVYTLVDDVQVDKQTVSKVSELQANDFVTFKNTPLSVTSETLSNGADGTQGDGSLTAHQKFLNLLESESFDVLICANAQEQHKQLYAEYTKRMRDEFGVKFQTVLYNYATADYEGVVNLTSKSAGAEHALIYWVGGALAGCPVNRSITNMTYDGEREVICDKTQAQLENAIINGELVFHKVGNEVRVLKDINSLKTLTKDKGEVFKDNQTIRVIDMISNEISSLFNSKYNGLVQNDRDGRVSLWSDVLNIFNKLAQIRAIDTFNSEDLIIDKGASKGSVVITSKCTVISAMTHLYMTTTIE